MLNSSIADVFEFLHTSRDKKLEALLQTKTEIPDFLSWCSEVSPEYDFTFDWIKYVENKQSTHDVVFVSTPPQHGKSTTFTIHKAAYLLEYYPQDAGIIVSYNSIITNRFHREILSILERRNVPLYSKSQHEIVHANLKGSISFCGFNGGITSKPCKWMIIDDPIRNAEDAYSTTYQEILWSGFQTSIMSRFQKKMKLWVTHTRWHDMDLIGQIMTKCKDLNVDLNYVYIALPAICDSEDDPLGRQIGELLCPKLFTEKDIKDKIALAEADGYALYQCKPAPPDGNLFKISDVENEFYTNMRDAPYDAIKFISVDAAFKGNSKSDFVAILLFHYDTISGNLFLEEIINERASFTKTVDMIREVVLKFEPQFGLVEAKANGDAIVDTLTKEFPIFIPINPEGGKIARAYAAQPFIKTHRLKIFKGSPNFQLFLDQFKSFPSSANDDMVDALTQAINYIKNEYGTTDYGKIAEGYHGLTTMRF